MSEFGYGFGDGCLGFLGVDFLDGREEVGFVERVAVVTGDVGAVEAGVAEALDEFEDGVFEVGFGEGGRRHCWGRVFWCLFEAVMSILCWDDMIISPVHHGKCEYRCSLPYKGSLFMIDR